MKNKSVPYIRRLATGVLILLLIVCTVARVNAQNEEDTAAASNQTSSENQTNDVTANPGSSSEQEGTTEPPPTESQSTAAPTGQPLESTPTPGTPGEEGDQSGNAPVPEETPGTPEPTPIPTAEPTVLPSASPENMISVTIVLNDVTVSVDDAGFSLMNGVTAHDQNGAPVEVKVLSSGGFDIHTPGTYQVEYGANQGTDMIVRNRTVQVIAAEETEGDPIEEGRPRSSDPSSAQYQQMLQQRSLIHDRLSEQMQEIETKLSYGLQNMQLQADTSEDQWDWGSILAYYVAKSGMNVEQPLDLLTMDPEGLDELDAIVAAVLQVTITEQAGERTVSMGIRPAEESVENLGLSQTQVETTQITLQSQYQEVLEALLEDVPYENLTGEQAQTILAELPADVSPQRQAVIAQAQTLLGKISYEMGGKYNQLGWNPDWDTEPQGKVGLDCSGFVSWMFINAFQDPSALAQVGNGSTNQWTCSNPVDWNEAKVGDLIFAAVPGVLEVNHVGVIADIEPDGTYWVMHCISSELEQGVVLTEAWESGFRFIRRPKIYGE